jgi:hypothetical protein
MENTLPERSPAAKRAPTTRSKLTNRPRKQVISGNSAQGRRLLDLADAFAERLGGWSALSDMAAANVRKTAELTALAEQARRNALRNGCADPDQLIRLENAAARAVKALGIDRKREPAAAPSLSEYLRSSPVDADRQ